MSPAPPKGGIRSASRSASEWQRPQRDAPAAVERALGDGRFALGRQQLCGGAAAGVERPPSSDGGGRRSARAQGAAAAVLRRSLRLEPRAAQVRVVGGHMQRQLGRGRWAVPQQQQPQRDASASVERSDGARVDVAGQQRPQRGASAAVERSDGARGDVAEQQRPPRGASAAVERADEAKRMRLTNNSLSGALPPQWSALTGMWRMYLSSNSLSGALPPQWSALAGLGRMNLGGNGFSGALPPEWSGLRFALDGELVLAAFPPPYAVQEAFGGYDETGKLIEFDLNNKSVSLRPPGSSVCVSEAVSFPEGLEGTELKLSYGDSREVTFGGGFSFPFFGTVYSSVHIGSYGCLTFGGSDNLTSVSGGGFDSLSGLLRAHNALPRVSAAFTDLDPEDGGSVTYRQLRGRFVVTFSDVPARTYYGSPAGVLSFQIVLHGDGEVTVTYLRVRGFSGSHFMAGVSSGSAADAFSMDLSAVPCAAYGEAEALMALKDQQRSGVLPDWSAARPSCGWSGVKCSASGEVLELDLSREGLTGTLPPRWSELKSITDMDMHGNRLAGTLPPQWSELTVIADMDLGFNILSGTLPPQWSTLSSLKRMRMEENSLTGALPPQWSTLSDIDRMHLSGNDFTGTLPPEWSTINSALDNVFPATTAANPSDSSGEDIWRWTGGLAVTVALAILIL
eukprot:CAMPEP_0177582070 /NCGR_PEP_ID=MMETSP0419_2-20121207/2516_1 /TAXON_ID=582737 /ORGANISM="Tetraselmis sp., Strain GSL018" /LENGTH=679 /DNA_ID=CAMNT_0019071217 /DNA_START=1437 /DNA_END=3477 /DNA_ORIENTATION=-